MSKSFDTAAIGQSGGPTAVINQSLVGVIEGLRTGLCKSGAVRRILGMRHGVNGLVKGELVELTDVPQARLDRVARTPSAALGSSRDKPDPDTCERILRACAERKIGWFFYIGGNDSSDTCRLVSEMAKRSGVELVCIHVPKTVDNDLPGSDHTPGYPSAARFVATAFRADSLDNRSLPGIKINVVMGRHAGFLTAASSLARQGDGDGPHLIYLPEVPFDSERFIGDVDAVYSRLGRCQIAVSEGIVDAAGKPIGAGLIKTGQTDSHGNVQLSGSGALGDALAELVKDKLTTMRGLGKPPRVRADTLGYLQRCWPDPSPIDSVEAREAGRVAARWAADGVLEGSVAIVRMEDVPYRASYEKVDLSTVAGRTRHLPADHMLGTTDVSGEFMAWARPLIGELPEIAVL